MQQSFSSHADPAGPTPRSTPAEAEPTGQMPPEADSAEARGSAEEPERGPGFWPTVRPALLGEPLPDLPEGDAVGFAGIRRDWEARLTPIDEAERAVCDSFACAAWRRRRLDAVDERVLRALGRGEVPAGMPSLETLIRYRARLAKDAEVHKAELNWLWRLRPLAVSFQNRNPARRDWVLEMVSLIRPGWWPGTRNAAPEAAPEASGPEPAEAGPGRAAGVEPAAAEPSTAGRAAAAAPEPPRRPAPEATGSGAPNTVDPSRRSEPARTPRPVATAAGAGADAPRPAPGATAPRPAGAPAAREPQPTPDLAVTDPAPTDRAAPAAAASGPSGVPPTRETQAAPERSRGPSPEAAPAGGSPLSPFARVALERPVPTIAALRAAVAAAARRAASG